MPKALTKQAAASAAESASRPPTAGTMTFSAPLRQIGALQDGLEGQPFGDEPVEGRKCGDRNAADEKDKAGQRHAMDETAQLLHVPLAGRRQHGARTEKQQALEKGMIENVEQRGGKRQCRGQPIALAWKASARPRLTKMTPMFSIVL